MSMSRQRELVDVCMENWPHAFFFFFIQEKLTVTAFKPRLYIAGLPECPLHSTRLKLGTYF